MELTLTEILLNHKHIKLTTTKAAHGLLLAVAQTSGDAKLIISNTTTVQTVGGPLTASGLLTASAGLTVTGTLTLPATSIADAALSSNIPFKSVANVFTNAINEFKSLRLREPGNPAYGLQISMDATTTGGWARGMRFTHDSFAQGPNGSMAEFGVIGSGATLTRAVLGWATVTDGLAYNGGQWLNMFANGNVNIGSVIADQSVKLYVDGTARVNALLTASNGFTLTTGTLTLPATSIADAALSANVPLKTALNEFTNQNNFKRTLVGDVAHCALITGDSVARFVVTAGGVINWGPGGVVGQDTNLYRSAVSTLKTDDAFQAAGLISALAGLTVTGVLTLPAASVADAALSANVPLKNVSNTFAADVTVQGRTFEQLSIITASTTITTQQNIATRPSPAAALTLTLPAAPATGHMVTIKGDNGNEATNNITIAGNGKTIDGAGSIVIAKNYGFAALRYNGVKWNLVAADLSTTTPTAAMSTPAKITADGGTGNATYTLPGSGQNEWVFKGGIPQLPTVDYTKAAGKITFVGGNIPAVDEDVVISCSITTHSDDRTVPTYTTTADIGVNDPLSLVDATAGAFTVTLPIASNMPGRKLSVTKVDSSDYTITITPSGAETIRGSATYVLEYPWEFVTLCSTGSAWVVVGE